MEILLLAALGVVLALIAAFQAWRGGKARCHRTRRKPTERVTARSHGYRPPKPPWVHAEVIRLKALMPENGCRKIAITFHHLHAQRSKMTVGKSYVANVLRTSQQEVLRLRQELKHRQPKRVPKNLTWGLDLTTGVDSRGGKRRILGVLDHGTRACLGLRAVRTKKSSVLLRALLDLIDQYGSPKILRTDNEAVFTSWLFRFGLLLLGIRHQRTAPFAPWQNGRIERFFGTFKRALRARVAAGGPPPVMQQDLDLFRGWYNHIRPHQHLDGRCPAWAWANEGPSLRRKGKYFSEWGGTLSGFYWSP